MIRQNVLWGVHPGSTKNHGRTTLLPLATTTDARSFVPEGHLTIAQCFNIGNRSPFITSPAGTAEIEFYATRLPKCSPRLFRIRDQLHSHSRPARTRLGKSCIISRTMQYSSLSRTGLANACNAANSKDVL